MTAYQPFASTGGVAEASDKRLVNEAHQVLCEFADRQSSQPKPPPQKRSGEWREAKRLRDLIDRELERRGINDSEVVGTALGYSAAEAEKLLRRRTWLEGDLALLQAAAARLGLAV